MTLPTTAREFLAHCAGDDDTARLVFADWLDGEGSEYPERETFAQWAEWIRGEVELETVQRGPKPISDGLPLFKRCRELRAALEPVLRRMGGLDALYPHTQIVRPGDKPRQWLHEVTWDRGLPAVVTVPTLRDCIVDAECHECCGRGRRVYEEGFCPSCNRGTRPEPSPWLRALVREWGCLVGVVPAECQPIERGDDAFDWEPYGMDWAGAFLVPQCLFDLLKTNNRCSMYCRYPTPDAARAALGASVVAFGRGKILDARSV